MNGWHRPAQTAERVAAAALCGCGILALANLPADELPLAWLLAFTLPAALVGLLQNRLRRPWQRGLLAVALQVSALALLWRFGEPLSRPAALACTILPPLAFVIARRADADAALGLFLSFCVLLVGIILDGVAVPLVACYGAFACLALRSEAHLAAHGASQSRRTPSPRPPIGASVLLSGALLGVPCLFAALAIERGLGLVPSPSRAPRAAVEHAAPVVAGPRMVGLDDSFLLDGGSGVLSDARGAPLLRVHTKDGGPVPRDLYLRSGFFAVPGLDRWQIGALDLQQRAGTDHLLHPPLPQPEVSWLEFDRRDGARNLVFVPPHACELRGVPELESDAGREWLRQRERAAQTDYAVGYQRLLPDPGLAPDRRGAGDGLLTLPAGLDRAAFDALLHEWDATGSAARIAERIGAGLARHCRYDQSEPRGPHAHALLNFLFAPDDRRGYCMHFASAAALLLRLQGVPCRIGVGLHGGDAEAAGKGARLYGARHAHAWVEIPCAGRGYVVFDPTPARTRSPDAPAPSAVPGDGTTIAASAPPAIALLDDLAAFAAQPWLPVAVLLLVLAAAMWPVGAPRSRARPAPPAAKGARTLLARILRALGDAGHPRSPGQTLELFAQQLAARQQLAPEVRDAFAAYQHVRFGGRAFDGEHERRMLLGVAVAERSRHGAGTRTAGQT